MPLHRATVTGALDHRLFHQGHSILTDATHAICALFMQWKTRSAISLPRHIFFTELNESGREYRRAVTNTL
jgi:hypothetical protein